MSAPKFGEELKARLKEKALSLRKFGKAVDWSHSNLSKMINGSHEAPPPPLGRELDQWCGILDVSGEQRQRWHDLAALAYIPAIARPAAEQQYEQHKELMRAFADLQQRVREMHPVDASDG